MLSLVVDLCLSPALCLVRGAEWCLFLSFASSLVLNLGCSILRNQEVTWLIEKEDHCLKIRLKSDFVSYVSNNSHRNAHGAKNQNGAAVCRARLFIGGCGIYEGIYVFNYES